MVKPVEFFSDGVRLAGDLYLPEGLAPGEQRSGILLCHGYTGIKALYLPDLGKAFSDAGYVVLAFDYKGWGESDGEPTRLIPDSRIRDTQAALTFLGIQDGVAESSLGLYGTSYGGSIAIATAAVDQRARCVVSTVAPGNGARWLQRARRPDEYADLLEASRLDRIERVTTGKSRLVPRGEVLALDRHSIEVSTGQRAAAPGAIDTVPLEFIDDTIAFNPEWFVGHVSPRPILFITSDADRLVLPEESYELYARAGEPKRLVVLEGFGHYDVYREPALSLVIAESLAWYRAHLPAIPPAASPLRVAAESP